LLPSSSAADAAVVVAAVVVVVGLNAKVEFKKTDGGTRTRVSTRAMHPFIV